MPHSEPRLLTEDAIAQLEIVSKHAPQFEFMDRDFVDSDHQKAAKFLQNLNTILTQTEQKPGGERQVAIKRSKQNRFNDRDGI